MTDIAGDAFLGDVFVHVEIIVDQDRGSVAGEAVKLHSSFGQEIGFHVGRFEDRVLDGQGMRRILPAVEDLLMTFFAFCAAGERGNLGIGRFEAFEKDREEDDEPDHRQRKSPRLVGHFSLHFYWLNHHVPLSFFERFDVFEDRFGLFFR